MIKKESTKFREFEQLMSTFDQFFDDYFKAQWPFHFGDESHQRDFRSDAKLLIYLFFLWLDSEDLKLIPISWGNATRRYPTLQLVRDPR